MQDSHLPRFQSGRRDLNSGPLVPQTAPAFGGLVAGRGGEWTFSLQIAPTWAEIATVLHERVSRRLGSDWQPGLERSAAGAAALRRRPTYDPGPSLDWSGHAICSTLGRPAPDEKGDRMAGFLFRLETTEGEPANPPTLSAAVPDWKPGHTIHLGHKTLVVVGRRDDDAEQPPVLIVEEAS